MTRLPEFVVLGQGKAGTSLIYRVFEQNPDVGLSRPKELLFFSKYFDKGLEWYAAHFSHLAPDVTCVGEVSPAYLIPKAIDYIHETLGPDIKLIYILRHPVDQGYSRYLQNICAARGGKPLVFDAPTVLARRLRQLHASLEKLYESYDRAQILQLSYEHDIDVDMPLFETKICDFLGLPLTDYMAGFRRRGNVNAGVKPRFVYGGADGLTLHCDGDAYFIPAGELVFCAQPRNSQSFGVVTADVAKAALARQAKWADGVDATEFEMLQMQVVEPFTKRLENDFGLHLPHWRGPARSISYAVAPPPPAYLIGEDGG